MSDTENVKFEPAGTDEHGHDLPDRWTLPIFGHVTIFDDWLLAAQPDEGRVREAVGMNLRFVVADLERAADVLVDGFVDALKSAGRL